MEENHDLHDVTVQDTDEQQLLYADDQLLMISGSGFNPVGNTFRFSNGEYSGRKIPHVSCNLPLSQFISHTGLLGNGVNFTVSSTSETSVSLRLAPGSLWRKNFENLPGPLTLLAVNAGQGFVAVGPTNAGKGRDVAMIFERPQVYSDNKHIFRTHSHELHIRGTGFPLSNTEYRPKLKFNPPLVENVDYILKV